MDGQPARTPEDRARLAERAMGVVNEHPDANVRKLYAGQVAAEVGLPVERPRAHRRAAHRAARRSPSPRHGAPAVRENAEFVAVALLAQDWDSIAGWLVEELFHDEAHRRAFLALADAGGDLGVGDRGGRPRGAGGARAGGGRRPRRRSEAEARNLIAAAVRRQLAQRSGTGDAELIRDDAEARLQLEALGDPISVCGGGGVVARLAPSSDGGTRQWGNVTIAQTERASTRPCTVAVEPPVMDGVDAAEWRSLIDRGRQQGSVHAEQVTHVLRHVELTGDVLDSISHTLAEAGISLDETVDEADVADEPDDTPTDAAADRGPGGRRRRRAPAQPAPPAAASSGPRRGPRV